MRHTESGNVLSMNLLALLDLLAPPLCAGCGASAGESEPLCSACRRELRWLGAEPIPLGADDGPPLVGWAPVAYEGPARGLVRALKFKGASRAAGAMAAQLAANAPLGCLG